MSSGNIFIVVVEKEFQLVEPYRLYSTPEDEGVSKENYQDEDVEMSFTAAMHTLAMREMSMSRSTSKLNILAARSKNREKEAKDIAMRLGNSAPNFVRSSTTPVKGGVEHSVVLDVIGFLEAELLDDEEGWLELIGEHEVGKGKVQMMLFAPSSRTDEILTEMRHLGLGTYFGKVYVVPVSSKITRDELQYEGTVDEKQEFLDTVKERGLLTNLVEMVELQARLSFDYVLMAFAASFLAAVGLVLDNPVVIVASMLVSPIMGPILGITFGVVIEKWALVKRSLRNESIGLFICVLTGMLVGLFLGLVSDTSSIPGDEMISRGEYVSLYAGVAIAIPSGIGVALSVTGSNVPALVGVAISASLLPPAVNTGLVLGYATIGNFRADTTTIEMLNYAWVSFVLVVVNILCIILFGIGVFKLKEVAPLPGKSFFWESVISSLRDQSRQDTDTTMNSERIKLQKLMKRRLPNFGPGPYVYDQTFINEHNLHSVSGRGGSPRNHQRRSLRDIFGDGVEVELGDMNNLPYTRGGSDQNKQY